MDKPLPQDSSYMTDRIRLPLNFDVDRLQKDLKKLQSCDWIAHFVQQNYDGEWDVLPLRSPASATHPVMMIYSDPSCTEFVDTHFLENTDYLRKVLQAFHCPLLAVRLMKLSSGSVIKEHTDLDLDIESGVVRLHVPIQTNDNVDFQLNGSRVILPAGECWYLRLSDPHSVANHGDEDRVHLVIDAEVNDWLAEQLQA